MPKTYTTLDGDKLSQQNYLYGDFGDDLPEIPAEVSVRRLEALKEHLHVLLEHTYHTRDSDRVSAVLKAIKYWENI